MLLTLLISALAAGPAGATAPAGHSPISAYDDPSTWKRTEFDRSKDLVLVLEEYRFGMHHTDFVRKVIGEDLGFIILAHPHRRFLHSDDAKSAGWA